VEADEVKNCILGVVICHRLLFGDMKENISMVLSLQRVCTERHIGLH
jgi:hypothetical protein